MVEKKTPSTESKEAKESKSPETRGAPATGAASVPVKKAAKPAEEAAEAAEASTGPASTDAVPEAASGPEPAPVREAPSAPASASASAARTAPFSGRPGAVPGFLKDFDFSKFFSEMKVPAMPDMEAVITTHKRNLEALSDANRMALEGAQAVAKRHMEIMQATMAELTETMKSLSKVEAPASRAARHAEMLKQAYEHAVSNTRELGDLIQKSNAEAMQKLNHRFSEAMAEMKTLFNKL